MTSVVVNETLKQGATLSEKQKVALRRRLRWYGKWNSFLLSTGAEREMIPHEEDPPCKLGKVQEIQPHVELAQSCVCSGKGSWRCKGWMHDSEACMFKSWEYTGELVGLDSLKHNSESSSCF